MLSSASRAAGPTINSAPIADHAESRKATTVLSPQSTVLADLALSDMGYSATAHEARYIRVVQHARGNPSFHQSGGLCF